MKNKNLPLLICIIASALIVVVALFTKSFWGDEIWSIKFATLSGQEFINALTEDYHPPLYFILLKVWIYLFGIGELALRSYQFLLGSCFLFSVYLLFNKLIPNRKFHPVFILFILSGELWLFLPMLRYYILASTLAVLSTYIFFEWINNKREKHFYFLLISYILILYTDYPTAAVIAVHFVYLFFIKGELIKKYLIIIIITAASFIPWAIILLSQVGKLLKGERIADLNTSPLVLLLKIGYSLYAFVFSEVVYPFEALAITLIILLAVILSLGLNYSTIKTRKYYIAFSALNILGGILFTSLLTTFISRHTSFIYTPSRTFFVFPFVYLLFAFLYENLKNKKWKIIFITVFLILNMYSIYNYSANRHFLMPVYASPWKAILAEIEGEKGIILADETEVYKYYSSHLEGEYPEDVNPNTPEELKKILTEKNIYSIFLLTLGRESTEPTINIELIEYIRSNFKQVSEKKFLYIDESYKKIKNKILKRESYDAKFTLQKFARTFK